MQAISENTIRALSPPGASPVRIVIADDNPEDRADLRRRLLAMEHRSDVLVETATGAATVRSILDPVAGPPACVLLDYTLPDMTAPEVLAAVAGADGLPPCPVVVVTGLAQADMGRAVLRAGAQDYVGKGGITEPVLHRALENAAERWALSRELHAGQTALRDSEERYRRLVTVLPAAVLVHDGHDILFCNPAFVRLVGAGGPAVLLGRKVADFLSPDCLAYLTQRPEGNHHAGGEAPSGLETHVTRLDGAPVPVHAVATPLSGVGPQAWLVALSDLTERERSAGLLRAVLGSVADAILTTDDQGVIRSANPATERLFGHPAADVVGQSIALLLPGQTARGTSPAGAAAAMAAANGEVEGRRRDGTCFPAELAVTAFRLGGEMLFTQVIRDITARRSLEEQLRQAQKMEAVGRLAGGIAHDFNNLLTVISGYSDMVLADLPPASPLRGPVSSIHEAGERAARLTQQLLAFGRRAVVQPRSLDLNEVVRATARLLGRLIGEDIRLRTVTADAPAWIWADPGQVDQLIMNLVVNARDAMPTGGNLAIDVGSAVVTEEGPPKRHDLPPGEYVRLAVADTGHGMSEEVLKHIFEPFYTTKEQGKGTGLGLAVVHGVVKQCGGSVAVDTRVGRGTTFEVLFPLRPPDRESEELAGWADVSTASRGPETILLVEDEDSVRKVSRIALEVQGYSVLEASGAAEALRLAEAHHGPIHLLLTDVVMPDMGGRQLAEAVRAARPGLRVLYMSGYTDDAVAYHGAIGGGDHFIQKPFGPLVLARKVRCALDCSAAASGGEGDGRDDAEAAG